MYFVYWLSPPAWCYLLKLCIPFTSIFIIILSVSFILLPYVYFESHLKSFWQQTLRKGERKGGRENSWIPFSNTHHHFIAMLNEISVNASFSEDLSPNSWFGFTQNLAIIIGWQGQPSTFWPLKYLTTWSSLAFSIYSTSSSLYHNLDLIRNFFISEIVNSDTSLISLEPLVIAGNKSWFKL